MSPSEASEVLPTFESLGYRLIVRSALPAVVRGLFVGTVAPDAPPTAATIERLEWWLEDDFVAREVALIDPVDDAVRGRFRTQNRVRGCCALGDDRCIYVEGRAIVSRSIEGDDRRVHCAEAFGEQESPTDHPVSDGRVALLGVVGEDDRASVRVIALDGAGDVRSIELGARPMALGFNGSNIIVQTWIEPGEGELRAFDRETLAPRWSVQCEPPWDERVCVGAVVATDAEAAPFGQRPIIARVDQRRAAIDPRDGSVRFEPTEDTPSLFEGDAMGADRVALWASVDALEVRSVLDGAVLARFALREPLSEARAMPGRRWAVLSGRQLVLCDAAPGAALAGALLPRNGALVLTGDRWITVVTEACEPNPHQPLLRSRALRAVDPRADAPAVRVPMSDALLAIEEPADARALAVDPARIDAILRIAEDERWNDGASWERLVAQGLVDEGFDRASLRVEETLSGALLAGPRDRSLDDAASRALWLALAHDAPRLVTALALAREFTVRIRPFCVEPVDRVVLRADATMTSGFDPGVLGFALATLELAARWDPPPVYGNFYRWLCERDALWSIAAERGVRLPSTAPSSLLGRSFSEAPSPFAPLIALYELGVPPLSIGGDALSLRLWPIEGRQRAARWDDDIPF